MKILHKKTLTDISGVKIFQFDVEAPHIAQKAQPGQFIVAMAGEEGERIPLTIVDTTPHSIRLIMQEAGLSTKLLGRLNAGDSLYALVGPLGHPTPIEKYGNVIIIAGGVGIAEIYPIAKKLKEAGNHLDIILGARTKAILFLEKELRAVADNLHITTDDGSYGRKGFTTDVLKELLEKGTYAFIYAVGPLPMMEKVSAVTKQYHVKTYVSLNALMLDASGMCGGCRVTVDGKVKFACVDGPEFDAHLVDWDELMKRSKMYVKQEQHICKLHEHMIYGTQ